MNISSNLSYLFALLIIGLYGSCNSSPQQEQVENKPNVLLIFTDQQHVNMMSAAGNALLHTPNMDRLARRGVLFKQSYCTSPVCGPARSSIITGRMPHETGVEWNGDSIKATVPNVGEIFRKAGYQTVWGGKWHLPDSYPQRTKSKHKVIRGFDLLPFRDPDIDNWMLGAETDPPLTAAIVDFLNDQEQEAPFFLAVSYHNPHDICFYPRKDGWITENDSLLEIRHYGFEYQLPAVVGTHPDQFAELPPLPDNHEINTIEPEFVKAKRAQHDEYGMETKLANQEFTEKEWRGYLNAYHRLTEMVDTEIGKVLDALEANGLDDNTIIVFTSDHGDGAAAHKWSAKLSLYQESATVPLIVSWPKAVPSSRIDDQNLVSQIDIVPTLCDYAGVSTEASFTGKSLRPILDDPQAEWREHLVVELADFKPDRSRKGRMLRTADFKYNRYNQGDKPEQFFNLSEDPGETRNLINEVTYQESIAKHRALLAQWIKDTQDNFKISN